MLTMLLYVLIVGLVAALLFLVASAIFGRSEELGPLPEGTTVTVLPAAGISGCDVRALRFQQVFRGYKAGEVDWALTRLAARIDELEGELARVTGAEAAAEPTAEPGTDSQPGSGEPSAPRRSAGSNGEASAPRVLPAEPAAPAEHGEEPGAR
ncbi:DivIVA domain-containing protein [Nocardia sp. NPDC046763]|uniref:DivIVA domain-containing protein n=1 Tax=Nocardia sp. NPDC046763 TaxID=3155256 RepID=UPI0033D8C3E3